MFSPRTKFDEPSTFFSFVTGSLPDREYYVDDVELTVKKDTADYRAYQKSKADAGGGGGGGGTKPAALAAALAAAAPAGGQQVYSLSTSYSVELPLGMGYTGTAANGLFVTKVKPGSNAEKCMISVGQRFVTINGKSVAGLNTKAATAIIKASNEVCQLQLMQDDAKAAEQQRRLEGQRKKRTATKERHAKAARQARATEQERQARQGAPGSTLPPAPMSPGWQQHAAEKGPRFSSQELADVETLEMMAEALEAMEMVENAPAAARATEQERQAQATELQEQQRQQQQQQQERAIPSNGASTVDMGVLANPPHVSTHDWTIVRDRLYAFGRPYRRTESDPRQRLYRAALAMNLVQEDYGTRLSVVGTQGGRLFPERIVYFCLKRPSRDKTRCQQLGIRFPETLAVRIGQLRGTQYSGLMNDLYALNEFGNRVDHDELPDLKPHEKQEVVDLVYRVASGVARSLQPSGRSKLKVPARQLCKWEQGEFAAEGCWRHNAGKKCMGLHRDQMVPKQNQPKPRPKPKPK